MSEMQAGREMDAIIAQRLFGWRWFTRPLAPLRWLGPPNSADDPPNSAGVVVLCDKSDMGKDAEDGWWLKEDIYRDGYPRVPHYSSEISAAWEVVQKMRSDGYYCLILEAPDGMATVSFYRGPEGKGAPTTRGHVPLAICAAALAALEDHA